MTEGRRPPRARPPATCTGLAGAGRHRRAVPRRARARRGCTPHGIPQPDRRRGRRAARRPSRRSRRRGRTGTGGGTTGHARPLPRGAGQVGGGRAARRPGLGGRRTARRRTAPWCARRTTPSPWPRPAPSPTATSSVRSCSSSIRSTRCATRSPTAGPPARSTAWRSCCGPRRCRSGSSPTGAGGRSSAPGRRRWSRPGSSTRRPGSRSRPRATRSSSCCRADGWSRGGPEDRLHGDVRHSVAAAEEITEALGVQVRRAVELLVQALSEAALDARDRGEPDPLPAEPVAGLRGGRDGDDAGGVPAVRRGTRPAPAGPAVRRGLRHQRRARRPRRPGAARRAARRWTPRT